MYCELHCHTYYSLLDGASSPEALLDRAVALSMQALAITDHDGLYGAVEFWRAARERGIRPVIGAEVTLAHGSHLTLLAETQAGYANLSRLISVGQLAGTKGHPQLTIEDVARHAGGLLCLSGCRQGAVAQALLAGDETRAVRAAGKLADIFGRDRFRVELQQHWLPDDDRLLGGLLAVAQTVGAGVVATNDVHYAIPAGHRLHDVLTATRHNAPLADPSTGSGQGLGTRQRPNSEFYLKGAAEMAALFADLPDALAAPQAIAERCDVSLDFSRRRLPAFPPRSESFPHGIPAGETAFSTLYTLSHAGLCAKCSPVTPQAIKQLAHELTVIESVGLSDYFLIVWDIVREARARGIRCQGRGSAANSLVAYLLGITPVDPLAHNLLFERFLSDRTDTTPDIDLDFERDRRDEVIAYVYERYGREHTALVCNVVTYQPRLAVRDAARALGFPPEELGRISERAEEQRGEGAGEQGSGGAGEQGSGGVEEQRSRGAEEEGRGAGETRGTQHAIRSTQYPIPNTQYPPSNFDLLADLASQLIGIPRHLSVHVGGMLVTSQPLVEVVPLEHATKPGIVVAQWNKDSVEDAGLVKIDLLSLATLSMVSEACALIEQRHGVKPDLDALPLDDPAVYRLLAEGDAIGCFQVESRAQSSMLPRLKPQCFEDLVIEVAIVRPGPIQGGMVNPYLRRRQGLEPVTYLHPSLEPALRETLGVVVFQEQVIRAAIAVAGFTPGEADLLRRAMSRSRSAEAMAALRARFLAGAEANGVEAAIAEEVFIQLQGFATYGFCKSHAASFALIAYQTLWLKAHYPAEFYCALLNHQPMGFYSPEVIAGDAGRHGITVLRPDVNRSEDGCTLEQGSGGAGERGRREAPLLPGSLVPPLRLGLRYLSGLGDAGRERVLAARGDRPFGGLTMESEQMSMLEAAPQPMETAEDGHCEERSLRRSNLSHAVGIASGLRPLAMTQDRLFSEQALVDFCRRTRLPRPLVGDLIRAGALDGFGSARRQLLWALGGVQYQEEVLIEAPDMPAELPDLTEQEVMGWDYELLGLSPDDHPLRLLRPRLRSQGVLSADELSAQPAGKVVKVAGMVIVRQAPPTAKGHLFITLEDETGLINLVIRPDLYERERSVLHRASLLLGEGRVQREGAAISLLVQRVATLRQPG